jgi:carbamate kinase
MYSGDPAPAGRRLIGVEGVIDKDHASARLAADIGADALVIATDVDAVYLDWGQPGQRAVRRATPEALSDVAFPEGSMGPKVQAACAFAQSPGRFAAIGQLADVGALLRGETGTIVSLDANGVEFAPPPPATRSSVL